MKHEKINHNSMKLTEPLTKQNAMSAVFNTRELFSQVLSHLQIRDLTRALSVSTQWQGIILYTVSLRRILFLAPKRASADHLDWKICHVDGEWRPVIVHKPSQRSKVIVELHPILKIYGQARTRLDTRQSYDSLTKTPASTFLSQPPVTEVSISGGREEFTLKREGGVTFDDVVQKVGRLHRLRRDAERARQARDASAYEAGLRSFFDDDEDLIALLHLPPDDDSAGDHAGGVPAEEDPLRVRIEATGFVAENSKEVRTAREAPVRT